MRTEEELKEIGSDLDVYLEQREKLENMEHQILVERNNLKNISEAMKKSMEKGDLPKKMIYKGFRFTCDKSGGLSGPWLLTVERISDAVYIPESG